MTTPDPAPAASLPEERRSRQAPSPSASRAPWPGYVTASLAWHAGAGALALVQPQMWPWAAGAVVANHLVLTGGGLWPRSQWLGTNWTRLPAAAAARGEVALTIDDGPDPEVTPQVLDLLDAQQVKATFFVIAERAAREPGLTREIVRRGHSVQNHSDRHPHTFSFLGARGMRREIGAAQQRLAALTGQAPRWFRAPAGLRNPILPLVLPALGLELVSWTRRGFDTREGDAARVEARLLAGLAGGDILLLHDGHAARGANGRPVLLDVLPQVLVAIDRRGLKPVTLQAAFDGPSTFNA